MACCARCSQTTTAVDVCKTHCSTVLDPLNVFGELFIIDSTTSVLVNVFEELLQYFDILANKKILDAVESYLVVDPCQQLERRLQIFSAFLIIKFIGIEHYCHELVEADFPIRIGI